VEWLQGLVCDQGQAVLLQILLEPSLDLFAPHPWLDYVLKATSDGRVDIVRILIDAGVSRIRGAEALKIISEAVLRPHSAEVIRYLIQYTVIEIAPLHDSQADVDFELVHCIIGAT
jgi:hypothetical protein